MKKLVILGSSGSIGKSTLDVVDHLPNDFEVLALAVKSNIEIVEKQALKYRPKYIAVYEKDKAIELQKRLPHVKVLGGMEGLNQVSTLPEADMVVAAIAGTLGLEPTYHAIKAKKKIAFANKEVLISGGELISDIVEPDQLLPVDSEHSALFQCLFAGKKSEVRRLILTSSGGPFRTKTLSELTQVSPKEALNHPTWKMGPKVTIDCSTLMNKGLEVIEAFYLFKIKNIEVVVHPQSVIHSMVEYIDGSIMAQMSQPDMKLPIQYALTYPDRKQGLLEPFDFSHFSKLEFFKPDEVKFKCLKLSFQVLKEGGSYPGFLNSVNEVLVNRFLMGEIGWLDIADKLETLLNKHNKTVIDTLESVCAVDRQARTLAQTI